MVDLISWFSLMTKIRKIFSAKMLKSTKFVALDMLTSGVLRQMQFTKRRANSKSKAFPTNFEEIREQNSYWIYKPHSHGKHFKRAADQLGPDSHKDSPFFILDNRKVRHKTC